MSINVTVTGNPVCIKRGKMVTADPKDVHKEFQKRRKIRLEQVRQQSKEIAETVRNKVKKEKSKQLSNIEKQGAVKFSEWQNNKLLELQSQYRESLKDIGLGHTQARIEEAEETDFIERRDMYNDAAAHTRGLVAEQQEQINKNEESLRRAIPTQTRRMARDIEDARSAVVSKMKHTPKKRRKKSLVNVSIMKDVSDSEDVVEIVDVPEDDFSSSKSSKMTEFQDIPSVGDVCNSDKRFGQVSSTCATQVPLHNENQFLSKSRDDGAENRRNESPRGSPRGKHKLSQVTVTDASFDQPFDTRISDRIKNRRIIDSRILSGLPSRINENSESSSEDLKIGSHQQFNRTCKPPQTQIVEVDILKHCSGRTEKDKCVGNCSTQVNLRNDCMHSNTLCSNTNVQKDENKCMCLKENKCTCRKSQSNNKKGKTEVQTQTHKMSDLPSKPTVSIRSGVSQVNDKKEYTRVQYYDHDNRFSKDYIVDGSHVQKISEESIEVCPDEDSDSNFHQVEFQREKVAEMRGKKALEKEKIQRDYEVLLQRLPALQKQDRIASLDPNKDKLHMSENRLKEFEKHRQHRIESAYEKLMPNTITIQPKKQRETVESPIFKTVDLEKDSESNLAWKSATNLAHTNSKISNENLRTLLEKLKTQKAILMQENNCLPGNSNLYNIIADLEKCNRKSAKCSTTSSSNSSQKNQCKGKQKFKKSSGTPKRRSSNVHRDVLVLQNTSTQTSPKIEKPPLPNVEKMDDGKCVCPEKDDKICEIFIKIQENEKPEILISSPKDKKGVVSIEMQKVQESPPAEVKKTCLEKEKKKTCMTKKESCKRNIPTKQKSDNSSFWREQLSKNDTTNSSTSYYSPPNYSKDSENGNICNILHKKPQQSNICAQPKQARTLNPELLAYVQKLLEMSKGSIENLCVSSVSEVSTPTSSIIETQNNMNPAQKLISLLKHLNINVDSRTKKLNTLSKRNQTEPETSSNKTNSQYSNGSYTNQSIFHNEVRDISEPDFPENVLVKNITEITDKCQDKINKLTAKIKTLRAEKFQIISPTNSNGSDKENNTSYLNLPSMLIHDANSARSTSPEQEELNRRLLQIDTSNLGTVDEANDLIDRLTESVKQREFSDDVDGDILERYVRLFTTPLEPTNQNNHVPFVPVLSDIPKLPKFGMQEKKPPPSKGFNIARKYNMVPHELSTIPEADSMRRSKSPESPKTDERSNIIQELLKSCRNTRSSNSSPATESPKDLSALKKVPQIHSPINKESSPINKTCRGSPEFMSTPKSEQSPPKCLQPLPKSSKPQSKETSPKPQSKEPSPKPQSTPNSPTKTAKRPLHSPETRTYSISPRSEKQDRCDLYVNPTPGPSKTVPKSDNKEINSAELIQIIRRLKDVSTDSSTDKSEDVEAMLRSMGMGWAVATLKKTQEALARDSSTSSSNSKLASSSTDMSLKESQSSSTTSKSSNNNFLQDNFQDISTIQGSNLSAEKQQRTSTPVQTTKSSDKSKNNSCKDKMFTGESDLSSVKERSKDNEWNFISIPDYTADDSTMN